MRSAGPGARLDSRAGWTNTSTSTSRWKQLVLDDGALPWTLAALGLAVLWVLLFLAEIQSPNWMYWSGRTVQGSNQGGIVFYQVHGQTYTIDDPDRRRRTRRRRPVPADR